ncbi:MAG TPA: FAD-dependent oxidoreductase [Ktedonobacteraceae bacterium]|nr:FAD-dependent oxidoreductase [Ktedonobacteraceae bacterium]
MTKQVKTKSVDNAEIVIVGNGIAGLTAAVEARKLAPDQRIVMITDQNHPTINTPSLKQFAIGKLTREQLLAYPAGTERAQRIHVINARVEEIQAEKKYVCLTGGRGFGYESLLIATGSVATGLPQNLPGRDFDGVLTLHRLNDYLDMRRRLSEIEDAVVVGGGFHAIETVVSLLYWGIRVHWLIRSDTFLPRMLDRPASDMVLERIRRAGAKVYTQTEVIGVVGRVGAVNGVVTNQHQFLPSQLVLVCTGTTPATALATHCDLPMKCKRGILVDDQLRTSVRSIYAAGDVAALKDPQSGEYAPRAQWYAAVLQGRIAAAAMTGSAAHEEGFGVPWHATRLGELSMLTVGNSLQWRDIATTLTDSSKGSYRRLSIVDDRLVGYLSLGPSQPDGLAIKRLIDEDRSIRHIKKALLKGNFDARKYFSHQRTYAAHHMVQTGTLPVPGMQEFPLQTQPHTRTLPETGPLVASEEAVTQNRAKSSVNTHPLYDTRIHDDLTQQKTLVFFEQNESLFFEEGFAPALAKQQRMDMPRVIESTLDALPTNTSRRNSGSLWSYSDTFPAVKARPGNGQFIIFPRTDKEEIEPPQEKIHPSSSLWSYTDKHMIVKKGH